MKSRCSTKKWYEKIVLNSVIYTYEKNLSQPKQRAGLSFDQKCHARLLPNWEHWIKKFGLCNCQNMIDDLSYITKFVLQ